MALVHFLVLFTIQKSNLGPVFNHKTPQINIKLKCLYDVSIKKSNLRLNSSLKMKGIGGEGKG